MKYKLKDAELQKKIDEITDGYLSKKLENHDGSLIVFWLNFFPSDMEPDLGYDPNAWNDYPYVRPPEDVLMLVECVDCYGKTFKTCAEYIGDGAGAYYWRNEYEQDVPVKRFRPLE